MAAAYVQSLLEASNGTTETSTVATGSVSVSAGNVIVVACATYCATDFGTESVTDNLGNTYALVARLRHPSDYERLAVYAAPVTSGGTLTTITYSHDSSSYNSLLSTEFSGMASTATATYTASGDSGTTATWLSSATIAANGIAIGAVMGSGDGAPAAGSASGSPSTSISRDGYWSSSLTEGIFYATAASQVTGFTGTATYSAAQDWVATGGTFAASVSSVSANAQCATASGTAHTLSAAYAATILATPGLAAYWRLGEPSGTTATDSYGSADGTYQNTPTLAATGLINSSDTAATFARSSSEYVSIGTGLPERTTATSIEAWVKFTSLPAYDSVSMIAAWGAQTAGSPHSHVHWRNYSDTSKWLVYEYGDGSTYTAARTDWTPTADVAYHVVVTHNAPTGNGGTVRFYVNGLLLEAVDVTSYPAPETIPADTTGAIGAYGPSGGNTFDGTLDEVAWYTTDLSATTVAAHYAAGIASTATEFANAGSAAGTGTAHAATTTHPIATVGCATASGSAHNAAGTIGAAYYISPSGSDTTGSGTIGSPWRTINKFVALPPDPGDTLYCRGGTYANSAVVNFYGLSGTADDPITIRAYPGETPHFQGPATYGADLLHFDQASSYITVDGLTISEINCSNTVIWIGNTNPSTGEAAATRTHHITIRNCTITKDASGDHTNYAIYVSWMSDELTIEGNLFVGQSAHNDQPNTAIHVYHTPGPRNVVIRRNVIDGWYNGIMVWDSVSPPEVTATITHNTIVNCPTRKIDMWRHNTVVIRDNAGDATGVDIYDPVNSSYTYADHNFWDETFLTGYFLPDGSSAGNGATDGTDAGAKDAEYAKPGFGAGVGAGRQPAVSDAPYTTVAYAYAQCPTGTGAAYNGVCRTYASQVATATGAAAAARLTVAVRPDCPAGTAGAYDATIITGFVGALASGTAAAQDVTGSTGPTTGTAAGTGVANGASAENVSSGTLELATATGTAHGPVPSVGATGIASGTGAAANATASTVSGVYGAAECATGTASAGASASVKASGIATGTGEAQTPSVLTTGAVSAGAASGTGAAANTVAKVVVYAEAAAGVGAALPVVFSLIPAGGIATTSGDALAGSTSLGPTAVVGTAVGSAHGVTWSSTSTGRASAGVAAATAIAWTVKRNAAGGKGPRGRGHHHVPRGDAATVS